MPLHLLAAAAAFTQPALPRRAVLTLAPALALRTALRPAGAKLVTDPKGRFLLDLPEGFVQSKRLAATGTLFVAGDFPRFAVLSVTAWRTCQALPTAPATSRPLPKCVKNFQV